MGFNITKEEIRQKRCQLIIDSEAYSGVKKIANIVSEDIYKVFGETIDICESNKDIDLPEFPIIVGTYSHDKFIEEYVDTSLASKLLGKREVFSFSQNGNALVIAGSDKRGTIYGLFHLSRLIGVSPLVNWIGVMPEAKESVVIEDKDMCITKEPSVKYRGFFINDEWPAFGNWCNERFGGFNVECYKHVFELLLRLKGNYMWPAMWSAIFSNDGPGMANAELADELGVVMGMSHHEPCLRNGEEYRYLRGKDSIYGDAWNFRTNEAGITRFWEDGLKRNGHLENVITVGMRGEADSTIMGKDATLKDNIDLLRDVLKTQNRLIRENVNANLDEVPRMLALYKEVEPFFYGDENTEGLIGSEELEGVTLMLCDDNFGNLRTVPTEEMRAHKGGYGMYYHFDYHGWPVSYEWVNSSYLPKIWEQMCEAYEFGIRDLWIVNVGDIFSTEYPLSFFLDLAYDYDKWGINNINAPRKYTKEWVKMQFGGVLTEDDLIETEDLLMGYTKVAASRRPEAINDCVYPMLTADSHIEGESAPAHGLKCEALITRCEELSKKVPDSYKDAFFSLLYYPLMGNLNTHRIWTDTVINHYLSKIGSTYASEYARRISSSLEFDRALIEKLHTMQDGKWYGMGMSEHIGFANWNEEECIKPIIHSVSPASKPRIIVLNPENGEHSEGGDWTKRTINISSGEVLWLLSTSEIDAEYKITEVDAQISIVDVNNNPIESGIVSAGSKVDLKPIATGSGSFVIHTQAGGNIKVSVSDDSKEASDDEIIIEANQFKSMIGASDGGFVEIPEYGKYESAIKAFPVTASYVKENGPSVEYVFRSQSASDYMLYLYLTNTNPAYMDGKLRFGLKVNESELEVINSVPEGFRVGDDQAFWMNGVLDNVRVVAKRIEAVSGDNTIKLYCMDPRFVLQRIKLVKKINN